MLLPLHSPAGSWICLDLAGLSFCSCPNTPQVIPLPSSQPQAETGKQGLISPDISGGGVHQLPQCQVNSPIRLICALIAHSSSSASCANDVMRSSSGVLNTSCAADINATSADNSFVNASFKKFTDFSQPLFRRSTASSNALPTELSSSTFAPPFFQSLPGDGFRREGLALFPISDRTFRNHQRFFKVVHIPHEFPGGRRFDLVTFANVPDGIKPFHFVTPQCRKY